MPFSVVLDTCVLYPAHLRDTLLRLAERGLYRALWSADIVEELRRILVDDGFQATSVDHLLGEMAAAFPDAEVSGYRSLIDGLACDPKDRHVLATAVRADTAAIVTFNVRDFPPPGVEAFEIEIIDPDTFLLDQLDLAPAAVTEELTRQAAANRRQPKTLSSLLDALARAREQRDSAGVRRSDGTRPQSGSLTRTRVPRTTGSKVGGTGRRSQACSRRLACSRLAEMPDLEPRTR